MTTNATESNKDLARRYLSALDRKDAAGAAALVADDLANHAAIPEAQGSAGLRTVLGKLFAASPDGRFECQDLIAEGDRVVARIRMHGTNTGPLAFARLPLPATGKPFDVQALHVYRIEGGRIAEMWGASDTIALLRQLGHLSALTGPS